MRIGFAEVTLCDSKNEVLQTLLGLTKPGDLVLTLGAGDIYRVGEEFLKQLEKTRP